MKDLFEDFCRIEDGAALVKAKRLSVLALAHVGEGGDM